MWVSWTLVYAADAPLQRVEATQVRLANQSHCHHVSGPIRDHHYLACRAVVSQGPHTKTTCGTAFCPVSLLPVAWTGEPMQKVLLQFHYLFKVYLPIALFGLLRHQIIATMLDIHHVLPQLVSDIDVFRQTINFPEYLR